MTESDKQRKPTIGAPEVIFVTCLALGALGWLWAGEWRWCVSGLLLALVLGIIAAWLRDRRAGRTGQ